MRANAKLGAGERAGAHWILACVQRELDDHEGAAANFAVASECWSHGREATSKTAIKGLIDEAHSLDVLERHADARAVLERAAVLACGARITPDVTARAFTSLALSLRTAGELDAARELAEMILAGPSAIEPEVRKLALGIVDPQ